jgi:hypothetical protein
VHSDICCGSIDEKTGYDLRLKIIGKFLGIYQLTLERTYRMPSTLQTILTEYLSKLLHLYGGHLKRVILYGSYARGDFSVDL